LISKKLVELGSCFVGGGPASGAVWPGSAADAIEIG
jgi:hypothetical protein